MVRLSLLLCLSCAAAQQILVWPLPGSLSCTGADAAPLLSKDVTVSFDRRTASEVAQAAATRYESLLQFAGQEGGGVQQVVVTLQSDNEALGLATNYSYTVERAVASSKVRITAASPFGVNHGMETLLQLAEGSCAAFSVNDAPMFAYRGLMIDTGRRWYPVELVQRTIDAMSMMKMNVLHFHLSEECWRVESKTHPALHTQECTFENRTLNYSFSNRAYYTQEDVAALVRYAKFRGVRVVPEFDLPGHAGGLCRALMPEGMQCGSSRSGPLSQVCDDAGNRSVALVQEVLREMAGLFPDEAMHIGADETGICPSPSGSTEGFEEKILAFVTEELGKTPIGWNEILSTTHAAEAFPRTIIEEWGKGSSWQAAARLGFRAIASHFSDFYLDNHWGGFTAAQHWKDLYISTQGGDGHKNANATERALLLGGSAAMWSDEYFPIRNVKASCMFQHPERDANFSTSTSSVIWPRAAISAGSFYRFDVALQNTSERFAGLLANITRRLTARGVETCQCEAPSHHGCSQATNCNNVFYCPKPWPSTVAADETTLDPSSVLV